MIIKYFGREPVLNRYGSWKTGDVKMAGAELLNVKGFIQEVPSYSKQKPKTVSKKVFSEKLEDKFDRDNKVIKDGGIK